MQITFYRITVVISVIMFMQLGSASAQGFQDAQFGSIPDSLATLRAPADTPYMITNKEMDVAFEEDGGSIVAVLDYHVRLKVFDETARRASIISIPYYFDDNMEQVSDIEGWTHLPSGKMVALQKSGIRTVNINSRYNIKEFTMPEVSEGAILEYRYTIRRRYIEELPDFFLSDRVPTAAAKLTITYPRYLRYQQFSENYNGRLKHDFVYTDTSSVPKIFTIPQPEPIVTERWMAYNIPATPEEPFITSLDDHRAKLKFMMSEFGIPRQSLENNWKVVVAKLRRNTNPLLEIRKSRAARVMGDSIAEAHAGDPPELVQDAVFRFLNNRVNFSGAHAPYSNKADKVVLSGEPVNQAAINQTLAAMLRGAGIEANPVLVSTRRSGTINKDFPSFYQFNAQMVRTRINGQTYLLDASYAHSEPGLIPVDMYNGRGLVLKPNAFEWLSIVPDQSQFDITVDITADLTSEGTLSGTIHTKLQGYSAQQMRQQRADGLADSEIVKQAFFDGYPNIKLDSVRINNLDSYNNPVSVSGDFRIENYATSFSDGLEYRPMVVGYRMENPFDEGNRQLPISLDAPEKLDVSYTINLPDGYYVEARDQDQSVQLAGAQFQEQYNLQQQQLRYGYHIGIAQKDFSATMFPQLFQLYERWVQLSKSKWLIKR